MLQRVSANPPRGPRHGSPSVRGPSRGAIQKRGRAPPVRVDKDGDLDMDAGAAIRRHPGKGHVDSATSSSSRGAGRGRGGPGRGSNLNAQKAHAISRGLGAQQANILDSRITGGGTTLRVDGLMSSKAVSNPDGGLESLLGFLERKAAGLDPKSKRVIRIKKSHIKGDSVFITASPQDIAEISKLDKFTFAGATLSIQACESSSPSEEGKKGVSQEVIDTKEKFKAILANRYNGALKLLNLSALAQDPVLVQMGLGAFDGKVTSKLFPAMMVVCDQMFTTWQEKRDAIVSVTLANNGLDNVRHVTALAQTFPNLKNLDLSSNNLTDLKSIENWRWKFRHLENLVLTDNPITSKEPNFNIEVMRWYPKLQILNGIQVRTPEQVAATIEAANSPIPISGSDFRDVGQVGENFIRQFFTTYDHDRSSLLENYYDARSLFSMAINMTAPRDREHSVAIPPWAPYTKHSRNLVKFTNPGARYNRRYKGAQAIKSTWSEFPATRHPDVNTQADKYIFECHPVPGLPDPTGQSPRGVDGLSVTVHGEFEEHNPSVTEKALRSFSRTFVLGPGGLGGPPIKVISDMLCLRAYSPLAIPSTARPPPPQSQTVQPTPQIQLGQSTQVGLSPEQHKEAIAKQLMEKTGMTLEYAVMCLEETGWDIEKAYGAFEANKAKLPPNAFIAGNAQ